MTTFPLRIVAVALFRFVARSVMTFPPWEFNSLQALYFKVRFFAGTTSSNHFISSSPPYATFSFQVYGISILSYSLWSDVLYALDSSNSVIATNMLTNPNSGSSFFLGTLSLSSAHPMSRFTVLPSGCSIGGTEGSCDEILNLDN